MTNSKGLRKYVEHSTTIHKTVLQVSLGYLHWQIYIDVVMRLLLAFGTEKVVGCKNRVKSENSSQEDLKVVSIRDNEGHIISSASTIDIIKRNHMKTYPLTLQTDDKIYPKPPLILTPVSTTTGMQTDQLVSSLSSRLPYSNSIHESSKDQNLFLRQTSGTSGDNFNVLLRRPSIVPVVENNENKEDQREIIQKVLSAMTPKESLLKETPGSFTPTTDKEPSQIGSVRSLEILSSEFSSPFPRPIYLRDPPVRSGALSIPINDETDDDDELGCNPDCKVHIGHPDSLSAFSPPSLSTLKEYPDSLDKEEYNKEKTSSGESSIDVLEQDDGKEGKEYTYKDSFSENIGFLNMAVQQLLEKEMHSKNPIVFDSDSESNSTTTRIYLHESEDEEISMIHNKNLVKDEVSDSELLDNNDIPGPVSASDSDLNKVTIPLNALYEEEKAKSFMKDDISSRSGSSSPILEQFKSRRQSTSMTELTKFDLGHPKVDKMMHDDRFSITTTSI
nr:uncharacterized protein LOC121117622 [Lepeophtheirus salmonis]